jgi:hypothetical protein
LIRSFSVFAALIAALALIARPLAAPAATTGLAWDSVSKFVMDKASSLQPGSFDSDFAIASAPPALDRPKVPLPFGLGQAMKNATAAGNIMMSGVAERHYVAGTRERTDDVGHFKATILDCAARTITTLDLKKKTYKIVSLDQPVHGTTTTSEGQAEPGPAPTDDGTKIAIDIKNLSLGREEVGGETTDGFKSNIKMTTTRADGESKTNDMDRTAYYSVRTSPRMTCSHGSLLASDQRGASMMGGYVQLMQTLSEYGENKRFTLKQSGPALPLSKMSMWDLTTFSGGNAGDAHTGGFLTERANIRSIQSDDAIFSVPGDFTKEQ